uniref:Uncharacterized protein n=1 Tax=Steinernema glaseri TaxID=37863 RepID=A0A1I7YKA2_9BILA
MPKAGIERASPRPQRGVLTTILLGPMVPPRRRSYDERNGGVQLTVVGTVITSITLPWHRDQVAEWLRRWTANPLGFPRVSSNLILIESFSFAILN